MAGFQYGMKSIWETRPESIDMLRGCIDLRMSASETAAKMAETFGVPVTPNMCVSKARRLGIRFDSENSHNTFAKHGQGKPRPLRAAPSVLRAPKPTKRHKTGFYFHAEPADPVEALPPEPIAIPVSRRVSISGLTFMSCRWPLGYPRHADFGFCGADRVKPYDDSNAYCAEHARIAYTPRTTRQITPEHRRAMLAGKSKAKRQREASWSE